LDLLTQIVVHIIEVEDHILEVEAEYDEVQLRLELEEPYSSANVLTARAWTMQ
jgi:hypothetical protein